MTLPKEPLKRTSIRQQRRELLYDVLANPTLRGSIARMILDMQFEPPLQDR